MTPAASGDDTCIGSFAHEVPGAPCAERAAASCAPGEDPESVASSSLSALLAECFLTEIAVGIELEQGCALRLSLSREPPGGVDCLTARLGAVRYDCLGDLTCAEGEVSTLR